MSERGSFVTQYIYDNNDYLKIRKALDKNSKYLCVSPPCYYGDKTNELPIVSGKVGSLSCDGEIDVLTGALDGITTDFSVDILVYCDSGTIALIRKEPYESSVQYYILGGIKY